jgi:hypothetical protein
LSTADFEVARLVDVHGAARAVVSLGIGHDEGVLEVDTDEIALLEEDALRRGDDEALVAGCRDRHVVVADDAVTANDAARLVVAEDEQREVAGAGRPQVPLSDISAVWQGVIRVQQVNGVLPAVLVLPCNDRIAELALILLIGYKRIEMTPSKDKLFS